MKGSQLWGRGFVRNFIRMMPALAVSAPAAALSGDGIKFTAGRWQETTTIQAVTLGGETLPLDLFSGANETGYSCVASGIDQDPEYYFMRLEPGVDCEAPKGTVAGGRISMAATCRIENTVPMAVQVSGTYDADSYRADVHGVATMEGQPLLFDFLMAGEFVGACTGDEDKPDIALARTSSRG
jgi:hypothetical protein